MNNFHPLEVVGHGSETQLQVGKNLNEIKSKDLTYIIGYYIIGIAI